MSRTLRQASGRFGVRNKPDLFIAVRAVGQIKASVHCPTVERPTWKRHYGFDYNATGTVANSVRESGESRHKATWSGANCGSGVTLEWRIFILNSALRQKPIFTEPHVILVPPLRKTKCLIIAVFLGPPTDSEKFPKAKDAETYLLCKGSLSDGRGVWITYCYVEAMPIPAPTIAPRIHGTAEALRAAPRELRASAISDNSDGSLVFLGLSR